MLLEKRKIKGNRDSSNGQGHYSLPEPWFLFRTKRKLIRIKKKLVATGHPVLVQTSPPAITHVAKTSSSSSSSLSFGPPVDFVFYLYDAYGFDEQKEKNEICLWVQTNWTIGSIYLGHWNCGDWGLQ